MWCSGRVGHGREREDFGGLSVDGNVAGGKDEMAVIEAKGARDAEETGVRGRSSGGKAGERGREGSPERC